MKNYIWETPQETDLAVAGRIRHIRRRRKITQSELAERSGVSLGSIKRFEQTGQISFLSLTRIANALDCGEEIRNLFKEIPYQSIEEVIREGKTSGKERSPKK